MALREIASSKKAVASRSWGGGIEDTACQEYLEQARKKAAAGRTKC